MKYWKINTMTVILSSAAASDDDDLTVIMGYMALMYS